MATLNRKQRLQKTSRIISQVALYSTQGNKNMVFKSIFDGFSELGGIYVKFLQVLSARAEFKNINSVSAAKRTAVFDAVQPDPIDVHAILAQELGPQYSQHLTNIQLQPFAAGSFGQVYFAVHRDGTPVIIKVLRPSLLK